MQVFAKAPTWLAIMAVPKRDDAIMHTIDRAGVSVDDVTHAACTAHRRWSIGCSNHDRDDDCLVYAGASIEASADDRTEHAVCACLTV